MGVSNKDPTTPPAGAAITSVKGWGEISPKLGKISHGTAIPIEKKNIKPAATSTTSTNANNNANNAHNEKLLDQRGRCLPFLEKTYRMIDSAPADLASWSEKGDSFIVYKPKEFAEEVIPQYFKHKNFSSFVRQLNFYGFRKTKANGKNKKAATGKNPDGSDKEWWEFRHERFVKGNKALMKTIKRKTNMQDANLHGAHLVATATIGEVKALRSDIAILRNRVKDTSDKLTSVTKIVLNILQNGSLSNEEQEQAKNLLKQTFSNETDEDMCTSPSNESIESDMDDMEDFDDEEEEDSYVSEPGSDSRKRKPTAAPPATQPTKKFLKPVIDTKVSPVPGENLISPRALKFDFGNHFDLNSEINICDDIDMEKLFDASILSTPKGQHSSHWSEASSGFLNIGDDFQDNFFDNWQTVPSPRHTTLNNRPVV